MLNWIDDHARNALCVTAHRRVTGSIVLTAFRKAVGAHGVPTSTLTDNGAIFTAKQRGDGRTARESTLGELGIKYSRSRPYHPQTCGKV